MSSITVPGKVGRNTTAATSWVQNQVGPGPNSQPPASKASSDGRTRLRRRLSAIFQTDKAVSGFACRFAFDPSGPGDSFDRAGPGTCGSSQPASCQSPRIHRCRRLASMA